MGEASNKMNHRGRDSSHKRVVELRDEINRKREQLTLEFDELRRRRSEAIILAKRGAKIGGAAALGLVVANSLLNAVLDIFRKDKVADEDQIVEVRTVGEERKEEARQSMMAALISALTSMAIAEIRRYAMEYARKQLRSRLDMGRDHIERRMSAKSGTDGNNREVA